MSFEDVADNEQQAHEQRIKRCKSCNAKIIFLLTPAGKFCPTDADTVEAEDQTFEWGRHVSHFTTCTDPNKHRKSR